jgi:hypothetical protein
MVFENNSHLRAIDVRISMGYQPIGYYQVLNGFHQTLRGIQISRLGPAKKPLLNESFLNDPVG